MQKICRVVVILLTLLCGVEVSGKSKVNYDEAKVPDYILPELLICKDGTKVTTAQEWEQHRRPEIMEFFSKSVYGETPKGEYLSAFYASPVYKLYGMVGLESEQMPKIGKAVMNDVGYHIRKGKHNITPFDWNHYLNFCDKVFGRKGVNKLVIV